MTDMPQSDQPQNDLPKTFDPAEIERRWYAHWEASGLFRPARPEAEPFTIVNPPPNVTGSLHIGHALDNTLQDVVVRYERLRGKDALWVVGTDHAGIATQMVVERQMEAQQDKRTNYTREQFVEKVWDWKRESGGTITGQLRRLGCSMDWSREQFTMDPHFTRAVVKVFVDLYNQGLIYRDKRLVNWDPKLKTAISDLEVETREVQGHFWRFRYPLADGVTLDDGADHIVVATTRPETMLADMAVAVHPEDARYASVVGKHVILPITGRRIPIVADEHADPALGSGAVKITPGHDFNDFEVGVRAGIKPAEMLNMFDADARVVQTADGLIPAEYVGQDRFDARKAVVEEMKARTLLVPHVTKDKEGNEVLHDAEPRTIQTPFGDRGGVVIEPWLTDQWYVDAKTLAQPAIEAVKNGDIEIVPKSWEKTFFHWMENIQPWCVSRQLWWGHRIPAWYGPRTDEAGGLEAGDLFKGVKRDGYIEVLSRTRLDDVPFVAASEEEAIELARQYYPSDCIIQIAEEGDEDFEVRATFAEAGVAILRRDEDVLDTWFSSALWPFATLGWPEGGSDESRHAELGSASTDQPTDQSASSWTLKQVQGDDMEVGTSLLARHYPNDLLISGFDILFFWDARMMMMGFQNMGQRPWKRLYLHGLVRAADGQKMSKSKGNVVDPLGLIDQYGADALRFFMAAMESQGRDVKMDEKRVEGYRNFATKLWNAARFAQGNGIGASASPVPPQATLAVNKWIIGEVVQTVRAVDAAMADLRFDAAANAVYQFVWSRFCDWYLELIKPVLQSEGAEGGAETRAVAGWALDQILAILHPFMPFVTEELWSKLGAREYELIVAKWPQVDAITVDADASAEIDWLIRLVSEIRAARTELNVPPGAQILAFVEKSSLSELAWMERNVSAVQRLARTIISVAGSGEDYLHGRALVAVDSTEILLMLEGIIDLAAERARLAKAIAAAEKERDALASRLNNPSFVERAKPEAVEKARADHDDKAAEAARLSAALARLG